MARKYGQCFNHRGVSKRPQARQPVLEQALGNSGQQRVRNQVRNPPVTTPLFQLFEGLLGLREGSLGQGARCLVEPALGIAARTRGPSVGPGGTCGCERQEEHSDAHHKQPAERVGGSGANGSFAGSRVQGRT